MGSARTADRPSGRTTPPRPVDIAALFPELAPLARTAVRLHPRPGAPTVHESSVGGPLLWPADEPWPVCERGDHPDWMVAVSLDDIRLRRATLAAADRLTPEQHRILAGTDVGHPWGDGPNALLPVAQLYLRDIPGLCGPQGADLLQVLWCPADLDPEPYLVWRSSASVGTLLEHPPQPADVEEFGHCVPEPCVVHPEAVTEYPGADELSWLDGALEQRIRAWEKEHRGAAPPQDTGGGYEYETDLSVAPGWKTGGWVRWTFRDSEPMHCEACDAPMQPLLNIGSNEWDVSGTSWIPVEDLVDKALQDASRDPVLVQIGRNYMLQIYTCPASFDHPHQSVMH